MSAHLVCSSKSDGHVCDVCVCTCVCVCVCVCVRACVCGGGCGGPGDKGRVCMCERVRGY